MSEEPRTDVPIILDRLAFTSAPKVYSQRVAITNTQDDVMLIFGISTPFSMDSEQDPGISAGAVCFMTHDHFRRFVEAAVAHAAGMGLFEKEKENDHV